MRRLSNSHIPLAVHYEMTGHRVARMVDPDTSIVLLEYWSQKSLFDRKDAPANIKRDGINGTVTYEKWGNAGTVHRVDGPAIIERDPISGVVTVEEWYLNGRPSRVDGGADLVERDPVTGTVLVEAWRDEFGRKSRVDAPAVLRRGPDGTVRVEEWWMKGVIQNYVSLGPLDIRPGLELELRINQHLRFLTP